jgi:hypothetical protein
MAEQETPSSATYDAGCHCGNISFSFTLSPPLPDYEVMNCGCSICRRAGYLLVCVFFHLQQGREIIVLSF